MVTPLSHMRNVLCLEDVPHVKCTRIWDSKNPTENVYIHSIDESILLPGSNTWPLNGISRSKTRLFSWIILDMKSAVFLDITPCSPLKVNGRFRELFRLHLQGRISQARNHRESRWRSRVSEQKRRSACQLLSRWLLAWIILRP
jgi:hypothetical protein